MDVTLFFRSWTEQSEHGATCNSMQYFSYAFSYCVDRVAISVDNFCKCKIHYVCDVSAQEDTGLTKSCHLKHFFKP